VQEIPRSPLEGREKTCTREFNKKEAVRLELTKKLRRGRILAEGVRCLLG